MRISALPQIYRNVRRWTEILSVLSKYGLADWLSQTNIEFAKDQLTARDGEALARLTREARIRMALTELGPTFIKLGQLMSTRPDVVGADLADELKQLRANVPADNFDEVKALVELEFGQPIEELFEEFDSVPVASASIGQVHRAKLRTGEEVVVKVQHIGIEHKIREDLEVLAGLAMLADRIPDFQPYRPSATTAEMARTLRRELDFGREERNLQQFCALLADDPHVRVPRPYGDLCTSRVLTMEYLAGINMEESALIAAANIDREEVAHRGANLYMKMIFTYGFYHADPHPGNFVLLPGGVIGLLDFGSVGRLDDRMREDIGDLLLAIVQNDVSMLVSVIKKLGQTPPTLDEAALSTDVADFVGLYSSQSLDRFDLSGALNDMIDIIHRYGITLPPQVGLLIKVLVTLEGTTKMLAPRFSLMQVMQPFYRKMMLRRLSPKRQLQKFRRLYFEFEQLAEILPRRVIEILDQVQAGKFDVHLDHRGLGPSVNRLVLGLLSSALFVGSSMMLSTKVAPHFGDLLNLVFVPKEWTNEWSISQLSLLGLTGCVVSILLGLRLLWAIGKSGHLDRKE
jgi:ubiquinone biosynthesis protein